MGSEHGFDQNDRFEIGSEELLAAVTRADGIADGQGLGGVTDAQHHEALADIRIRVGTLLKAETVSFLLGAGASVECGGQLIGSVPLVVERALQANSITQQAPIEAWLLAFYRAAHVVGGNQTIPVTEDAIRERRSALDGKDVDPLGVNFEQLLAQLFRWRSALSPNGGRLRLDGPISIDLTGEVLDECLSRATRALACACDLPTAGKSAGLETFKTLLRKLLTRPLNLKRVNVFTLNYDTLVEQAADAEGIVLLDGFVGSQRRVFRPESYEQDLYFPAETTEGRVHRFDRVLHVYKLHGSITWSGSDSTIDDPYGVQAVSFRPDGTQPLLIYPTPAKYGETLGMPYSELFRRFATAVVRPQSVLFVVGYGFGDEHVNAIIRQALAVPSFTLFIVDPKPQSDFVTKLRAQKDSRVWIAEGPSLGTLAGFVEQILPDLRDEEIRRKILATHRALAKSISTGGGVLDGD